MRLKDFHQQAGAQVAEDGIPLRYHDANTEYQAALNAAVLLDRSHEARIALIGDPASESGSGALVQRISTHDVMQLSLNGGQQTIFTNPTGRIIDRVTVYHRGDHLLLVGGPGRADALQDYLRRNIFFRDQVKLENRSDQTVQFALHGPAADSVAAALLAGADSLPPMHGAQLSIAGADVFLARRKPYHGAHWLIIAPLDAGARVWQAVLEAGAPHGLLAAGSLTYNTLRITSGQPAAMREAGPEYIPLEVGLWDEVSFTKGCYTGQEIIARMESRGRVARTLVRLNIAAPINAPAELHTPEGRSAGTITSAVQAPDGTLWAMGVVKMAYAASGTVLDAGGVRVTVGAPLGTQPLELLPETDEA